jgi:hypothetical protein
VIITRPAVSSQGDPAPPNWWRARLCRGFNSAWAVDVEAFNGILPISAGKALLTGFNSTSNAMDLAFRIFGHHFAGVGLIAFAIKPIHRPVLFRQERIGIRGEPSPS